jgi:branched-subunit amino acid transport protein
MMPLLAIAALAAITYALRIAGPLLADRVTVPAAAQRLFTSAAAVLLMALAATSALTPGHDLAGWARPAGVAAAGVLAARRAPFPVVVLVAASVTALLRLAGIHLSERARGSSRLVRLSAHRGASSAAPAPGVPRLRSRTLRFSCCYQRLA